MHACYYQLGSAVELVKIANYVPATTDGEEMLRAE